MTKPESITQFDPNGPGIKGNLFGLPYSSEESELVIIPVPWEVTVSYHGGTSAGPRAILDASSQIDLCLKNIPDAWKYKMSMLPEAKNIAEESSKLRVFASKHIQAIESRIEMVTGGVIIERINEACESLNFYVKTTAQKLLQQGKSVAVVGGDHSSSLGLLRALSEKYNRFGVLQIDAHADLRKVYEGFNYSHASIMHNALKLPGISRLVQVGIRDYCDEEVEVMARSMGRIKTFFDQDIKEKMYSGDTWDSVTDAIIKELPELVYISFDIDGLDPKLCPGTGTPVPGGLEFDQAVHLIRKTVLSGRKIIGFDLNEVAPLHNDWDANVGARLLYQLCAWVGVSEKKLEYKT